MGYKLGVALLQDEVLRSLVGEELGAMAQDEVVQLQHDALRGGVVLLRMLGKAETVRLGEFLQPIKSPLHRAHDAVGVDGWSGRFPSGTSSVRTVCPGFSSFGGLGLDAELLHHGRHIVVSLAGSDGVLEYA